MINKIYIGSSDDRYKYTLPVTPPEISITKSTDAKSYQTIDGVNRSKVGKDGLCKVTFSSHFPAVEREYCMSSILAPDCVRAIERIRGGAVRLTIVGMNFDMIMIIEQFDYSARQGGDIYYTLSLTEWR